MCKINMNKHKQTYTMETNKNTNEQTMRYISVIVIIVSNPLCVHENVTIHV